MDVIAAIDFGALGGGGGGGGESGSEGDSDEDSGEESDEESGEEGEVEQCYWAQCDKCDKWRRLPLEDMYKPENLPERCHFGRQPPRISTHP